MRMCQDPRVQWLRRIQSDGRQWRHVRRILVSTDAAADLMPNQALQRTRMKPRAAELRPYGLPLRQGVFSSFSLLASFSVAAWHR